MKVIQLTATDGSKWNIPVEVIARNRAEYFAKNDHEYGGSVERALAEDTLPLFESGSYEITDWAVNSMNWADVKHAAWQAAPAPGPDFQESWLYGDKDVREVAGPAGLTGGQIDTLIALVEHGPVWDGEIPSKAGRNDLIDAGLAVRVIVKGEDGYTAATYAGGEAFARHFGCLYMTDAIKKRHAALAQA